MREQGGARQDDVSREARRHGLAWSRSKVAALERGEKSISIEELALLPRILAEATGSVVSVGMLVPDDVLVRLTDAVAIPGETLKRVYGGTGVQPETIPHETHIEIMRKTFPGVPHLVVGEAEQKAAPRLGVDAATVATVAYDLWGRSLGAERDARVAEREPDASPDRRRALRGQVTRHLVEQVAAEIKRRETGGDGQRQEEAGR